MILSENDAFEYPIKTDMIYYQCCFMSRDLEFRQSQPFL